MEELSGATRRYTILFAAALLFGIAGGVYSEDLSGVAAKIEVTNASTSASGAVEVKLLDPGNSPAPAKKDLNVEIQTKAEDGQVEKSTVTIKQGQTAATATLPTKSSGVVEVSASNPQLATGGTVVNVPSNYAASPPPEETPAPVTTIAPNPTPAQRE